MKEIAEKLYETHNLTDSEYKQLIETEDKETDGRTWIIILAVSAGVVLAGIVTAVILVNRKKNRNKSI